MAARNGLGGADKSLEGEAFEGRAWRLIMCALKARAGQAAHIIATIATTIRILWDSNV